MDRLDIKRLVYGTYKLPQNYPEFAEILDICSNLGIEWLDTAPVYNKGLSESWISNWCESHDNRFMVATKTGKFYGTDGKLYVSNAFNKVIRGVKDSLERLKKNSLELLFLHDYEEGKTKEEIEDIIFRLLGSGLVQKVGLSNFPAALSEYLVNRGYVNCLQINCFAFSLLVLKSGAGPIKVTSKSVIKLAKLS
jgi:aryl-alcohol dehydrogenase-like predicted oxidoreductase